MDVKPVLARMMEALGVQTQTELGAVLEVSQSSVALAVKKNKIPPSWIVGLAASKNLNPGWLLSGVGPRFVDGEDTAIPLSDGNLGLRLRQARESFGFGQQKMAELLGCSKSAWVEYELNAKTPGGKVLAGLARVGVNVNWLLVGRRETVDADLLRQIFDRVAASLSQRRLASFSSQASELVSLLYDEIASGLLAVEGIDARIERLSKIMSFPVVAPFVSGGAVDEFGRRLEIIRGDKSLELFSKEVGVHRNTLFRYEKGESSPDAGFISLLCLKYNINPSWLLFGEGPKEK